MVLEQLYSHKQKNKVELLTHVIIQKLIKNELKTKIWELKLQSYYKKT